MSNVLYPLGLVQSLETQRIDRTLLDPFENGTTTARAYWGAQNFKRKFMLTHAPLKLAEYKYLRSFYSQRSGQYDSFWFRDNLARGGNASVRFSAPLKDARDSGVIGNLQASMDEVAPIRALPEWDELTAAAGFAPVLWYDANREYYLQHMGAQILDFTGSTWDVMENYRALWQGGSNLNLGNPLGQYQTYNFTGTEWAKTTANLTQFSGTQPAFTLFCIARHSTAAAAQLLFSFGAAASNNGLGLGMNSSNQYVIWNGNGVGTQVVGGNSPINTYRSLAVTCALSSGVVASYTNAVAGATPTISRSYTAGPFALGTDPAGGNIANPSNAMANANLAHVIIFNAQLSLAQIKAVHNLLGYQYGLAIVP